MLNRRFHIFQLFWDASWLLSLNGDQWPWCEAFAIIQSAWQSMAFTLSAASSSVSSESMGSSNIGVIILLFECCTVGLTGPVWWDQAWLITGGKFIITAIKHYIVLYKYKKYFFRSPMRSSSDLNLLTKSFWKSNKKDLRVRHICLFACLHVSKFGFGTKMGCRKGMLYKLEFVV